MHCFEGRQKVLTYTFFQVTDFFWLSGSIPGLGTSAGEGIGYPLQDSWAFLVAQLVKNPPAMWETWVQSLGWEDTLKKGKAIHSIFGSGEFHELYSPWIRKESDMTERLSLSQFKERRILKSFVCNVNEGITSLYSQFSFSSLFPMPITQPSPILFW